MRLVTDELTSKYCNLEICAGDKFTPLTTVVEFSVNKSDAESPTIKFPVLVSLEVITMLLNVFVPLIDCVLFSVKKLSSIYFLLANIKLVVGATLQTGA